MTSESNIFNPVSFFLRQTTQDAPEEVRNRDFRRELEERERAAAREKNRDRPTRGTYTVLSVCLKVIWWRLFVCWSLEMMFLCTIPL